MDVLILFRTFVAKEDYHGLSVGKTPISSAYKNHNTSRNIKQDDPQLKLHHPDSFEL